MSRGGCLAGLAVAAAVAACGESQDARLHARVAAAVEDLVRPDTAAQGLAFFAEVDEEMIPFVVGHVGDRRELPAKTMSLRNKNPNAFEAIRHIHVSTVDDALNESLKQAARLSMAGESWRAWCVQRYPGKARFCRGEKP